MDDAVTVCCQWEDNEIIVQTKVSCVLTEEEEEEMFNLWMWWGKHWSNWILWRDMLKVSQIYQDSHKPIVHLESEKKNSTVAGNNWIFLKIIL